MIGGVALLIFTVLFMTLHWRPTHMQQGKIKTSTGMTTRLTPVEPASPPTASTVSPVPSTASADPTGKNPLKQNQPLSPNSQVALRYGLAKKLIQQRRYASAAAVLKLVVDEAPDFAPAYRDLALCHLQQGHRDEAKQFIAIYKTYLAEPLPKELQQL